MVAAMSRLLVPQPIRVDAYAPFGDVLMASPRGEEGAVANLGLALRYDDVAELVNLRPAARLRTKIFRSRPVPCEERPVALLEKHPRSTQIFVPMNGSRYLAVVAQGGDRPDLDTLSAFVVGANQGISYRPGIWHHPMLALDQDTDFVALIHEDGTSDDCVELPREDGWPVLDLQAIARG